MPKKFPKLKSPAVLSPMAGVTDVAFREISAKYGAGLTVTEFASSAAIVRGSKSTLDMIKKSPYENLAVVQIFGNNAEEVVSAAKIIQSDFDIIDINCGCPVWKVVRTGAGSALLQNTALIGKLISSLVDSVDKPVTVKIRSGVDDKHINAVEVAKIAESNGASAITVHGRTQSQGYSGKSDWNLIKKVKDSVSIPVIGNGDVFTPEEFRQKLEESGVDAIMLARGAMGNPFIFRQITEYLEKGEYTKKSGIEQFFEYLEIAHKYNLSFSSLKTHAMDFTRGIANSSKLRNKISRSCDEKELVEVFDI